MGRGEEDGGIFDRSLRCLSLSRMICPQHKKPKDKKKRNLTFPDIFSLSRYTSLSVLLYFSQFSVASFDFCVIFIRVL